MLRREVDVVILLTHQRFGNGTYTGLAIRDLIADHIKQAGVIRGKLDDRLREP